MNDHNISASKEKIRGLLSEFLGISPEDINDEDSLTNDLHINTMEISDFAKNLEEEGFDISRLDLTEIDTFEDLAENLISNALIE